jgi:hypothetical protein
VPFQLMFAFDRVKVMARQHPEWRTEEPFASLLGHCRYGRELRAVRAPRRQHLKIAVRVSERRKWTSPDPGLDAHWLALLVVDQIDLRELDEDGPSVAQFELQLAAASDNLLRRDAVDALRPGTHELDAAARHDVGLEPDDAAREFAYDRNDKLQQFSRGWDEALAKGWTVVSMQKDWGTVFPPVKNQ